MEIEPCQITQGHCDRARELLKGFEGKFGAAYLQRHLRIGYNLSSLVLNRLEAEGVIVKIKNGYQFKAVK